MKIFFARDGFKELKSQRPENEDCQQKLTINT